MMLSDLETQELNWMKSWLCWFSLIFTPKNLCFSPEPPKVEQGLDAYSHPVGKNMPLQCRFSGNPAPNISWYHNGVPLNELDMAFEVCK